jgi:hypothetical protein
VTLWYNRTKRSKKENIVAKLDELKGELGRLAREMLELQAVVDEMHLDRKLTPEFFTDFNEIWEEMQQATDA